MKIAQVSPLFESVPPKLYGGTERIVSYLTEELVELGHEVTLFATGDSQTRARLVSPWCCALRLQEDCQDQLVHHFKMMEMVMREADTFDVIHYHIDYLHYPFSKRSNNSHLTTLHGRLDTKDLVPLYEEFRDMPVVSISNAQRKPFPDNNWMGTVYHGLPQNLYSWNFQEGEYLAFLGRIAPEKRVDRAIEVAVRTGVPLKIAAKVDKKDQEYYETVIKPMLDHPLISFIGEIGEKDKSEFLSKAKALLFLIDWPEPFGLVMIEAMACGTPVIAWRNGSTPEIVDSGKSGFIVETIEQAVAAVSNIKNISREKVLEIFKNRFSVSRMASDYITLYEEILRRKEGNGTRLFVSNY